MADSYQEDPTFSRHKAMLRTALGPDIWKLIADDSIMEVYVNTDYVVRVDSTSGRHRTNLILSPEQVKRICEVVAGISEQVINQDHPMLGIVLQLLGIRVQIQYPPSSPRPTFFFRKRPPRIFSLEEFVAQGSLSLHYLNVLSTAIKEHKNVVICGSTGSGKTTFLNAVLKKLSELCYSDRLCILEDAAELQCSSDDVQYLQTSVNRQPLITMSDLVKACLRLSPDRIMIGEVRDEACYDLLQAWNTGHPGGFTTVHADGCVDTFERLEMLVKKASANNSTQDIQRFIGTTVDYIVSIQKKLRGEHYVRMVDDIISVNGFDLQKNDYSYTHL